MTNSTGNISDGYHTFDELYEHRALLYISLCHECRRNPDNGRVVWRSKKHSDGTEWLGWFLLGLGVKSGKQITYHLPEKYWKMCDFARTVEIAPEFDGHSSEDVLKRLLDMINA